MKRIYLVTIIILAIAIGAVLAGLAAGQSKRQKVYGETPEIGVRYSRDMTKTDCQVVLVVVPPAHFNFLGQTWQDEHISWEDIRIDHKRDDWQPYAHGRSGPIRVGDEVCGLSRDLLWRWVYVPQDKVVVLDPA